MKGILTWVYRAKGADCTNGGITSELETILLVGKDVPEVFPKADRPILKLEIKNICGTEHVFACPVADPDPGNVGWMFGGNFVYSSDSRFPGRSPIPVHDRQESAEVHAHLSR